MEKKAIEIEYKDKKPIGIKIRTIDHEFTIALKDEDFPKTWNEMKVDIENHLYETISKKEAMIMAIYKDEINEKIKEAGGEELKRMWTTGENKKDRQYAWVMVPEYEAVGLQEKEIRYNVRIKN